MQEVKAQQASTGTIWTYGFGSIGVGIKNNLLGTWLLIYYNHLELFVTQKTVLQSSRNS